MDRHLLVPMDGSDPSLAALEYAFEVFPDDRVTVVHAIDELESHYGGGSGADGEDEPDFFEAVEETAEAYGVDVETRVIDGTPAEAILAYAENEGVDEVIVGSEGRSGVSRMLLGSVAETVARQSPVPVTIVR